MSQQEFIDAYVECAMWADGPEEETHKGWAGESLEAMRIEAGRIYNAAQDLIEAPEALAIQTHHSQAAQAGHDFWLTRNGHGAGFWDGDWNEPYATELTSLSRAAGARFVYIGNDGFVHQN